MIKSLENWISRLAVAGIFLPPSLSACWPLTWNDPAIRKWTLEQMRTLVGFVCFSVLLLFVFHHWHLQLDYQLSKNNVSVTIKYYFVRLWAFHCSSFHFSKIKQICFEKVQEVQKIFIYIYIYISSGKILINSNFQLLLWPSFNIAIQHFYWTLWLMSSNDLTIKVWLQNLKEW